MQHLTKCMRLKTIQVQVVMVLVDLSQQECQCLQECVHLVHPVDHLLTLTVGRRR